MTKSKKNEVVDAPVEEEVVDAPVEDAPVEDAPVEDAPVEDAPVDDADVDEVVEPEFSNELDQTKIVHDEEALVAGQTKPEEVNNDSNWSRPQNREYDDTVRQFQLGQPEYADHGAGAESSANAVDPKQDDVEADASAGLDDDTNSDGEDIVTKDKDKDEDTFVA